MTLYHQKLCYTYTSYIIILVEIRALPEVYQLYKKELLIECVCNDSKSNQKQLIIIKITILFKIEN